MKVCIGSVFASDDEASHKWLDVQLKFIQATTKNFEHVAVVWGGQKTDHFTKTNFIFPDTTPSGSGECHLEGLRHITNFFQERSNDFTHFLYLDCDAFPIKVNWLHELSEQMKAQPVMKNGMFSRMIGRSYDIAVAVRSENLERRLHASILLATKNSLSNISFARGKVGMDLRGNEERDIYLPKYEAELRNRAFVLMRSNKINLHPLACGVYYNMFYHHGCGSRTLLVRGNSTCFTAKPYWKSFGELQTENLTDDFMKNPTSFVNDLAGWTPKSYTV